MSDGWTRDGNFGEAGTTRKEYTLWMNTSENPKKGKELFVEHLNNPATQETRFATTAEIVRVVAAQHWRIKN